MPHSAITEPHPFDVSREDTVLAAERTGAGAPVLLLHGLTATRRYVLHGSTALARDGFELIGYDARGHGAAPPAGSAPPRTSGPRAWSGSRWAPRPRSTSRCDIRAWSVRW